MTFEEWMHNFEDILKNTDCYECSECGAHFEDYADIEQLKRCWKSAQEEQAKVDSKIAKEWAYDTWPYKKMKPTEISSKISKAILNQEFED